MPTSTQCAYADWLLDQHRAAEVIALLKDNQAADPVLLPVLGISVTAA